MITVHHLAYSRSLRVLWLLEELGVPYELVSYERTKEFRAPPELARIHPLGKAPVIVDDGLVLAESATILRYLNDRHGNGTLTPPAGTSERTQHEEWLDYVESSAGTPILISLVGGRVGGMGEGMTGFIRPLVAKTLDYITSGIGDRPYLMGDRLTLADIQMSYMLAMARIGGLLDDRPALTAYLDRLEAAPGFQRAAGKGGPMMPASF